MSRRINYSTTTPEQHRCKVLYETDTVVREEAIDTVIRISEKVQAKNFERTRATHLEYDPDESEVVRLERKIEALEQSLDYATSALNAIKTGLMLARGGVLGQDDETSLYFLGVMTGAVVDHGNEWSAHT